ncbi:hypothetical protein [Pedobacter kyonggii]|uniref:DUF3298 domain-containing protein n=1 Tax=Pedobacter kyonggii TaxID=1926871 RepID=A0A4V2JHC7_9SPHI|nr:hypothetical protein [Pedobacter kyonggii]TBO45059.1 hypothetical protein EYS08_01630 [Pedobacter kyonggii]
MKYKILFILILTLNCKAIFAQEKSSVPPLYKFLKDNTDTTFVLKYESNWNLNPEYLILSKKRDTINAYVYKITTSLDQRIVIPHNFSYKFYQNTQVPVDVNPYFNPKYLSADSLMNIWKELTSLKPWSINDDQIDGAGCPVSQDSLQRQIRDAASIKLSLITKKGIKELSFYAPQYYEKEICPGRTGRQLILKIEELFIAYIKR